MTVNVLCPSCLKQSQFDEKHVGRRATCGNCQFVYALTPDTEDPWSRKSTENPFLASSIVSALGLEVGAIRDAIVVEDGKYLVQCDCQKRLKVPLQGQGKSIQCPACKKALVAPSLAVVEARLEKRPDRNVSGAIPHNPIASDSSAFDNHFGIPSTSHLSGLTLKRSRGYVHMRCGSVTVVDGPEFKAMSDPLCYMQRSFCVQCQRLSPVAELKWQDTNEPLVHYYQRYLQKVPASYRMLAKFDRQIAFASAVGGFFLGGIAGLTESLLVGIVAALGLAIVGFVTALLGLRRFLTTFVYEAAFGTCDTRELN
jgi:hypothetical protein